MNDNIKVAVRLRPSNQKERYWTVKSRCIYMIDENGGQIGDPYYFDHIFDTQSNQEVYETVVKPLILCTIEGFNATVFAYGQTSTGKTYTMFGSPQVPGIMHLAVKDLFENIKEHPDQVFNLRASYLEIYNEKINDLLDPTNDDIRIRYDYLGNQILSIKDVAVSNTEDVFNVITEGAKNRKIGETEMNERSSRSHTIFRIIIESTRPEGIVQISILNLVDLAGSERLAQTKSEGTRRKEGVNINKSLLTLGLVIKQLSENREFVNFRDSKLTRLLQPSLGGNANTLIIATVSSTFIEETSSTLSFAQRAKKIKNRPEVKEIIPDDYCVQISKCKQRIKLLQEENEQLQKIMLQSKDKLKTLDRRSFTESNVVVAQRRRHTIGSQTAVPMPISEGVFNEDDDGLFMDADLYFDSCTPSSMGLTPITEESPLKTLKLRHQEQKVQQLEGRIEMLEEQLNKQIEINHKANSELEQLRELNLACDTKILELIDELTEKEQLLKNVQDVLVEKDVIMSKLLLLKKLLINCNYSEGANDESLKELRDNKDMDNKTIKDLQCKLMEKDDILEQYKRKSEEDERKISLLENLILQCDKKVEEKPKECLNCKNVLEQLISFEKCLNVNLEENKQIKDEYINCLKMRNEELECRFREMSMESNEKRSELQRINETLQTELKEMKSRENCEISELKKDISNMTQLLKEYEDNVMAKNEDINRLHRELCEIQLKIEKENITTTQELILENKNLVFKCSEHELKINKLLNEMNEMQTLKMEIINLRKECERKDIVANRLQTNTEALKGEKVELELGLKKMQSELDEKKLFIEKLQNELKQTKNVELSYKNELINLKKLIADTDNEKCKTIEELKRIKRECNEKHAEYENDKIKIQRLMTENKELLQKYEDSKLKMNQLAKENRKIQSLENELSNLKRECTNKDFSIDRLENDIKNLEQELNEKNSSVQSSSGISKTLKIFTSKELIRKPIISPPVHVQDDSDCDSKLNLELQLKIHNLQKREGMLVDENKTLLEKKQQLEAELLSSQEKLEILQTKYVQVKTICNHRFKEIRKLEAQLEAKQM